MLGELVEQVGLFLFGESAAIGVGGHEQDGHYPDGVRGEGVWLPGPEFVGVEMAVSAKGEQVV